jgi:hypothetical protein
MGSKRNKQHHDEKDFNIGEEEAGMQLYAKFDAY